MTTVAKHSSNMCIGTDKCGACLDPCGGCPYNAMTKAGKHQINIDTNKCKGVCLTNHGPHNRPCKIACINAFVKHSKPGTAITIEVY